jgi:hypothetical protein
MDDESKELLRRMAELQAEQTELLKKHLPSMWRRVRFSLLGLLLLMTFVAGGLGFTAWSVRSLRKPAVPTLTLSASSGTLSVKTSSDTWGAPAPTLNTSGTYGTGTYEAYSSPPGTNGFINTRFELSK